MARIRSIKPELDSQPFQGGQPLLEIAHFLWAIVETNSSLEKDYFLCLGRQQPRSKKDVHNACQPGSSSQLPSDRVSGYTGTEGSAISGLNRFQHRTFPLIHPDPYARVEIVGTFSLPRDINASLAEEEATKLAVESVQGSSHHTAMVA